MRHIPRHKITVSFKRRRLPALDTRVGHIVREDLPASSSEAYNDDANVIDAQMTVALNYSTGRQYRLIV